MSHEPTTSDPLRAFWNQGAGVPLVRPVLMTMSDITAARRPYSTRDDTIPQANAVYFLFKGDELIYVGQTNQLFQRLVQHWRSGDWWDSFAYQLIEHEHHLRWTESDYIRALKPTRNRREQ